MLAGLSGKHITALSDIFKRFSQIEIVKVLGARAKGNYNESSDIDLSIEGYLDFKILSKLKLDLDDSDIPYLMEIQNYRAIKNTPLKEHIDRVEKIIFQK